MREKGLLALRPARENLTKHVMKSKDVNRDGLASRNKLLNASTNRRGINKLVMFGVVTCLLSGCCHTSIHMKVLPLASINPLQKQQ
jgi:hypothetical protein